MRTIGGGSMNNDYRAYLTKFKHWLDDINEHELKSLQQAFAKFQQDLSGLERYTKEQLSDYKYYLQRDLSEFKSSWEKYRDNELDSSELNEELWQALSHLVDKTQLEWLLLQEDFEHNGVYNAGESVAFGEFKCQTCGEVKHITHPTPLDSCTQCNGNTFTRSAYAP